MYFATQIIDAALQRNAREFKEPQVIAEFFNGLSVSLSKTFDNPKGSTKKDQALRLTLSYILCKVEHNEVEIEVESITKLTKKVYGSIYKKLNTKTEGDK